VQKAAIRVNSPKLICLMKVLLQIIVSVFITAVTFAQNSVSFTANISEGCSPLTVNFTNTSSAPNNTVYVWDFGDGNGFTGFNSTHTFSDAGYYFVVLTAKRTNGSILGEYEQLIVVNGFTEQALDVPQEDICPGAQFNFSYYGDAQTISWYINNLFFSNDFYNTHSLNALGDYVLKLEITTECGTESVDRIITISNDAVPTVEIFVPEPTTCPGSEIEFYAYGNFTSGTWNFGDGTTAVGSAVSHAYSLAGNYNVTFTGINECGNTASEQTSVVITNNITLPEIDADAYPQEVCPGDRVYFEVFSWSGSTQFDSYLWNFGDGVTSTLPSPVHLYGAAGNYNVTVTVSKCGQQKTANTNVSVGNNLQIDPFSVYMGSVSENACPGDQVLFYAGGGSTYEFNFGDGSGVRSNTTDFEGTALIAHSYSAVGTYNVTVKVINGCGNSFTDSFQFRVVNNAQVEGFIYWSDYDNTKVCQGIDFLSAGGSQFVWNFGDGNIVTTNNAIYRHSYNQSGNYLVSVTVTNGCGNSETYSESITIKPGDTSVSGGFSWSGSAPEACKEIIFIAEGGSEYEWNFGDGTTATSTVHNIKHTYAAGGDYSVSVLVKNGCNNTATYTKSISVLPCAIDNVENLNKPINLKVYPNPSAGTFSIESEIRGEKMDVKIFNSLGQLMINNTFSSGFVVIDQPNWQPGFYFLIVRQGNTESRSKLLIQR
jgi:PKD repeat protein